MTELLWALRRYAETSSFRNRRLARQKYIIVRVMVLVLFGSQTGNSEEIAKGLADDLLDAGAEVEVCSMKQWISSHTVQQLVEFSPVVFVCSTTGNGDPPDNAQKMHRKLRRLPASDLFSSLSYCLLGLGDTNYDQFCWAAKGIEKVLKKQGAKQLIESCFADEAVGLESVVEPWKTLAIKHLSSPFSRDISTSLTPVVVSAPTERKGFPKFRECSIRLEHVQTPPTPSPFPKSARWSSTIESTEAFLRGYTSEAPFLSKLQHAEYLTTPESSKHVLHLELDVPHENKGMTYHTGDAIGIYCPNHLEEVELVLERLGLGDGSQIFALSGLDGETSVLSHIQTPCSILEALLYCVDLRYTPSKALLRVLAEYCLSPQEQENMLQLSGKSKESRQLFTETVLTPQLTFVELLQLFPSCTPSLEHVLDLLPELQPRYYSIASSPAVHPGTLHIAATVVTSPRPGLCSTWLYRVCVAQGLIEPRLSLSPSKLFGVWQGALPIFFRRASDFTLPSDVSKPVIMIGPGTGVAPFRGFLQHREATTKALHSGGTCVGWWRGFELDIEETDETDGNRESFEVEEPKQLCEESTAWLFFGCRSRREDYLYREDLLRFVENRTLDRLEVAFSRELEGKKVYVQDLIRENGRELCEQILEEGAVVFVCGDVSGMAKDVQQAFVDIFREHAEMDQPTALQTFFSLVKAKRYLQDIWICTDVFPRTQSH